MAFRLPTRALIAPGSLERLPEVAASYSPRRVLLATDRGLEATGLPERVRASLAGRGLAVLTVCEIETNPRHTTVDRMADRARSEGVDLVIGLGGGSALDAGKAAAMLVPNGGSIADYEGRDRFARKPLPFLAVPTTCGTGSEVTWVAVITHPERLWKMSIKGEAMFPDWALVDADLLATLPPRYVAWTGLDALTHALEATTGLAANPASDALALRAVALLFRYLRRAAEDVEGDGEARARVMEAATLAGMAFGNADVGAVHCLSETMGARWDLPHGLLNAVLLAPVLRSHLPAIRDRLAPIDARLPGGPTGASDDERAERVLLSIEALAAALGIPAFAELGIPEKDFPWIAKRAAENGSNGSNPRPMGVAEYLALLQSL
ncbi:MAG TPA: iron-containing alcohol dehydrogenase [Thermoanaerobaculia bacterium]